MPDIVTAAMLVIGDEILSGRTKDRNIGHLADIMTAIGIDLKEVRIVSDDEDEIVAAVNALRARYTYVFTTGGIGPTHDDITADSIAKAFGVPCDYDAEGLCHAGRELCRRATSNSPRRASAWRACRAAPTISTIPVSVAPGFRIGNVHVMAGVPSIFQAMLDNVVPTLKTGSEAAVGHGPLPVRRRRDRRAARRDPEGPSRHDHRLLSEISRRQVLDRTGGARPHRRRRWMRRARPSRRWWPALAQRPADPSLASASAAQLSARTYRTCALGRASAGRRSRRLPMRFKTIARHHRRTSEDAERVLDCAMPLAERFGAISSASMPKPLPVPYTSAIGFPDTEFIAGHRRDEPRARRGNRRRFSRKATSRSRPVLRMAAASRAFPATARMPACGQRARRRPRHRRAARSRAATERRRRYAALRGRPAGAGGAARRAC